MQSRLARALAAPATSRTTAALPSSRACARALSTAVTAQGLSRASSLVTARSSRGALATSSVASHASRHLASAAGASFITLDEAKQPLKELTGKPDSRVIAYYTAAWCGPCRAIAPVFSELAANNTDVVFVKIDVDENAATAEEVCDSCKRWLSDMVWSSGILLWKWLVSPPSYISPLESDSWDYWKYRFDRGGRHCVHLELRHRHFSLGWAVTLSSSLLTGGSYQRTPFRRRFPPRISQAQITAVPTFQAWRNGAIVKKFSGAKKEALDDLVAAVKV